jgi:hypothetical protein
MTAAAGKVATVKMMGRKAQEGNQTLQGVI